MKRIPIAAGLGGGSSDAATTLVGLNRLWRLGLSQARLQELGAQLGSDVPFFLEEQPVAVGRGRGERCEPLLGSLPILWHVLVCPPVQLSTKDVYDGFDRSTVFGPKGSVLTEPRSLITMCLHALRNGSLGELAKGLWNELEPEAIRRCPIIQEIHHHLRTSGCLGVMTSGSGPSVFGLCKDSSHAAQVTEYLQHQASGRWPVLATKTLASPPWDETLSVASDATTMESGGRSASTPRGAMA